MIYDIYFKIYIDVSHVGMADIIKHIMASLPREKSTLITIELKDLYSNGSHQTDK